jgi:hypothetical protein
MHPFEDVNDSDAKFSTSLEPHRTFRGIVYADLRGQLRCKRIATWDERLKNRKESHGLKEAVKLVITFYRNEAVGVIGMGNTDTDRKQNSKQAFYKLMHQFIKMQLKTDKNYTSTGTDP